MKTKVLLFFLFISFQSLFSQEIEGSWEGSLSIQGTQLPLVFNIQKNDNLYKTTLDSPMQSAKGIPIAETTFVNNELQIAAPNLNLKFNGLLKGETIKGTFIQNGGSFSLVLSRKSNNITTLKRPQEPKSPYDYPIEEVVFTNPKDKNTLAGTLTLPKNKKDFPVVILITGSGAQNRDSEIFGHKPFAVIANDFAQKGIGVLRLDDRGVGSSSNGTSQDTSANFATDIATAVDFLTAKGFATIGLIGHSEGGMIAPIVAVQNKKVQFVISLAGPGIPIDQMMLLQTQSVAKLQGATSTQIDVASAFNKKVYNYIINYIGTDLQTDFRPYFKEEFKKTIINQGLSETQIDEFVSQQIRSVTIPWYVHFLKFNPDLYWSQLKIPVLALNGSLDIQVKSPENLAGIRASLTKAGNKKATVKELSGLNHLFQEAKTGAVTEYVAIEQTIAPVVLDTMSNWILGLK